MTRFVVIASLRRGGIEPAEVLDDTNQERAAARWERDEEGLGEIVSWRDGEPFVGKLPGGERMAENLSAFASRAVWSADDAR